MKHTLSLLKVVRHSRVTPVAMLRKKDRKKDSVNVNLDKQK